MATEQDLDKSESATPYKLEKARERGQVAKSADVMALGSLIVMLVSMYAFSDRFVLDVAKLFQAAWSQGAAPVTTDAGVSMWLSNLMLMSLAALGPLFFALVVAAIVLSLAQTGPVFSVEPLKPDFSRLNPANGFQKLFSKRVVYESVKSIVKLGLIVLVTYSAIGALVPGVALLASGEGRYLVPPVIRMGQAVLSKIVIVVLVVALVDWVFSRWEFGQQMRMSRREIRDEHKHREGDPRIRAMLRELRMQMLKRSRALRGVKNADVVITNPTHYAIALSYHPGESLAPRVLATGAGDLAAKIRTIAARQGIPIVCNPPLARRLFRETQADVYLPESHYAQVAKIMAWVFAMRERHSGRQPGGVE